MKIRCEFCRRLCLPEEMVSDDVCMACDDELQEDQECPEHNDVFDNQGE